MSQITPQQAARAIAAIAGPISHRAGMIRAFEIAQGVVRIVTNDALSKVARDRAVLAHLRHAGFGSTMHDEELEQLAEHVLEAWGELGYQVGAAR